MLGIIMAGGQGSRLMPLTRTRPKPMVELLGRPVIDFVKDAMVEAGATDIVVTTGYRGEQLETHVASWNQSGLNASVNQESTPMGTAGSVGLLRDRITGTVIVGSGDAVASFDVGALVEAHRSHGAKVTMALWEVDDPSEFGIVGLSATPAGEVDGDLRSGFIRRFLEKPAPEEAFSNVINAGLYVLEPEVFEHVPVGEKFDFSKQLFPRLLAMGWPMYAQTINGVWFDVGQPSELLNAQAALLERRDELPFALEDGATIVSNSVLAHGVQVAGELQSSYLGVGCSVAAGAEVRGSLLMGGTPVPPGCVIRDSVIGTNVVLSPGTRLNACVVGDDERLKAGAFDSQRIPT